MLDPQSGHPYYAQQTTGETTADIADAPEDEEAGAAPKTAMTMTPAETQPSSPIALEPVAETPAEPAAAVVGVIADAEARHCRRAPRHRLMIQHK